MKAAFAEEKCSFRRSLLFEPTINMRTNFSGIGAIEEGSAFINAAVKKLHDQFLDAPRVQINILSSCDSDEGSRRHLVARHKVLFPKSTTHHVFKAVLSIGYIDSRQVRLMPVMAKVY